MLLIFEDGDEEALLKVQGLVQSASRIEPLEFRSQRSTPALEIRENQRRVFYQGQEILLTKTEYEILLYLFQNINQVLTHDQIYEKSGRSQTMARPGSLSAIMYSPFAASWI